MCLECKPNLPLLPVSPGLVVLTQQPSIASAWSLDPCLRMNELHVSSGMAGLLILIRVRVPPNLTCLSVSYMLFEDCS